MVDYSAVGADAQLAKVDKNTRHPSSVVLMDGGLNESLGDKRFAIAYANPVPENNLNKIKSPGFLSVGFVVVGNQLVV